MITLIGSWEEGWLDNRVELFMWKQLKAAFSVDRIVMVGVSDNPRICIDMYETVEEAIDSSEGSVVLLEPRGDVLLSEFMHPASAVYVFGDAMNNNLKQDGVKVRIDTPTMTDMFAVNAAAIVLADRML